jgi:hypothetical protein
MHDAPPSESRFVRDGEPKNKVTTAGTLALLLRALLSGSPVARSELLGHWEGAINQPSGDLTMGVDFSTQGTAATGLFSLSAAGVYQWPLKVTYEAPALRFRLPTGLLFEGGHDYRQGSVSDRRSHRYVLLETWTRAGCPLQGRKGCRFQ